MNTQDHKTEESSSSHSSGHAQTDKRGAKKKSHVPPPVCGTHGRVLELSATGVRARDKTEQEAGIATKTSVSFSTQQQEHHPGEPKNSRGRLKSARLQPLNVVNNAPLSSEDVLGIVPVCSISKRPRSSTSPGVQLNSGQSASSEAVGNRSRTKKRSYSAVVPRSWTVDGWEELFISKQVGLVPQTRTKEDQSHLKHSPVVGSQPQPPLPSTNRLRILPPVTTNIARQSEDTVETLKVEIKGLKIDKQQSSQKHNNNSSPASPRLPLLIPSPSSSTPNEPHNAANCEKATKCPTDSPRAKTAAESSNTSTPPTTTTVGKVNASIVSLGKTSTGSAVGSSRQTTRPKHNRHRHPSGKQSGRLSSGWSAPKPVGNVKGTPLQVPPHPHTHTDSNKHISEQERVVSPEMHITVTEYLLDDTQ